MERKIHFKDISNKTLNGIGVKTGIRIKSLSPQVFWRNDIVPFEISNAILFHPNSEKTETEKIKKVETLKLFYENKFFSKVL